MPAVSQQQQKFMGIVRAIQKGDAKPGDFSKKARDAAKKMKKKDVKKFAATKHDDLPKKVKKKESVFAIKGKDIGKGYKIATEPDFIYDPEKKMKKESINEDGHTDVASVERKLKLIGQYTIDLIRQLQNMSNEDSLPSWWTDKITLAKDYIEKSRNYLVVPVEGFASDAQRRAAFASGYKEKGKKKKKNEDITSSGYSQLKKIAYGISVGLKDLSKGIRSQNDDMVLPEIEYIYDKATEMKKMLKNKRFNESVNERISVSDERHFGKKGIIIMIDDNGKKVSAIFKDKKNADKFNRNKPSDIKKLLQLAKKTKYPKAIDESINEESKTIKSIQNLADKNKYGTVSGTRMNGKTAKEIIAIYNHPKMKSFRGKMDKLKSHELMDLTIRLPKILGIKVESVNEVSGVDVAKRVLKNKQYEKGIDLQTANLIVTIDKAYDKNPKLQKKFRALQLPKMKQLILKYYG